MLGGRRWNARGNQIYRTGKRQHLKHWERWVRRLSLSAFKNKIAHFLMKNKRGGSKVYNAWYFFNWFSSRKRQSYNRPLKKGDQIVYQQTVLQTATKGISYQKEHLNT